MKIAVASGKGGTGKTTIAANLAYYLAKNGRAVTLLDCDVEEPNCHLFFPGQLAVSDTVLTSVPEVDPQKCSGCGTCADLCQFSAIVTINKKTLTFPELCHGCGLCTRVCEQGAIQEVPREVGKVAVGGAFGVRLVQGKLRIGEAMSPPLIKAVKKKVSRDGVDIIDCPPGTSCPVIEAVKGTDFVLLVTEPTPFGLNDLKLAVAMVRAVGIPFAVVINRADVGDSRTREYCFRENIPVYLEVPDNRQIAEAYSRGNLILKALPEYEGKYRELAETLKV